MASVLLQRKKEKQTLSLTSGLRRETGKQRQPVSSRRRPFFSESIQLNPVIGSPFSFPIQAKLAIGRPGDRYEQEADRIAEQVVQEVGSGKLRPIQPGRDEIPHRRPGSEVESGSTNTVQRQCTECEEKEKDKPQQTKPLAAEITPLLQRQDNNEEEAPPSPDEGRLQTKSEASGGGTAHPQSLFTQLQASHGHGRPLPAPARRQMERGFGADFGPVRIHTDETAARLSRSLHAHAFTYGQNIYFNRGQFQPETREGQRLLAHELVHVGQQGKNLGNPIIQLSPNDAKDGKMKYEQEKIKQIKKLQEGMNDKKYASSAFINEWDSSMELMDVIEPTLLDPKWYLIAFPNILHQVENFLLPDGVSIFPVTLTNIKSRIIVWKSKNVQYYYMEYPHNLDFYQRRLPNMDTEAKHHHWAHTDANKQMIYFIKEKNMIPPAAYNEVKNQNIELLRIVIGAALK